MKAVKTLLVAFALILSMAAGPALAADTTLLDFPDVSLLGLTADEAKTALEGYTAQGGRQWSDIPVQGPGEIHLNAPSSITIWRQPLEAVHLTFEDGMVQRFTALLPSVSVLCDGSDMCTAQSAAQRATATQSLAFLALVNAIEADYGPYDYAVISAGDTTHRFPEERPDVYTLGQVASNADHSASVHFGNATLILQKKITEDDERIVLRILFMQMPEESIAVDQLPIYGE